MLLFVVISELTGVESAYEIPDVLWDRITPLLPSRKKKKKAGRPRTWGGLSPALPRP